ncbi:Zn-ribbon domain-containing OB-fold protein [Paraburkholderia sp. GAS32]|uniref:Zn-ribbon domain-containing OB-fold protein n=1 Tax=Paraburkholderia sp. GAS32 TaxID=3035129 RepID=UPI003D2244EA
MESYSLSETGRLYNYTIVYRSYPGISVPFISAVVDLDDGTSLKGNLLGVEAEADALTFGMPVKMVFRGAETANADALGFVAHFFVPA